MYDFLFKNVTIIDPVAGTENCRNVAVKGTKIALITDGIAAEISSRETICANGYYLLPGLIDYHTHLFKHGSSFGLDADKLLSAGITTAVDMGSAGWVNFPAMAECDLIGKRVNTYAYLNISPVGQPGKGINEPLNETLFAPKEMKKRMEEYPGMIVGVKVRISRDIVKGLGLTPLRQSVAVAEELNLPVCVHTTDPPENASNIIACLRPGDIYSHTYHGKGYTILDTDGSVQKDIKEAQKRGIIIEVGNGKVNFNFVVAEKAMKDGLFPDVISSDATPATFHNNEIMWDLPRVMSKFINLGMPMVDVINAATAKPAHILGIDTWYGYIREGFEADLALFKWSDRFIDFYDADGNVRSGREGFVPAMTMRAGQVVWMGEKLRLEI